MADIFLDPPYLFENVDISYQIEIVKFFFKLSSPLPNFMRKPNLTNFIILCGPL